jgi:hypothetical protein
MLQVIGALVLTTCIVACEFISVPTCPTSKTAKEEDQEVKLALIIIAICNKK